MTVRAPSTCTGSRAPVEGRNRQDATRDGHPEPRATEAYLKPYVEAVRGEPARLGVGIVLPSLSRRRISGCRRTVHESCRLDCVEYAWACQGIPKGGSRSKGNAGPIRSWSSLTIEVARSMLVITTLSVQGFQQS